MPDDEINKLCDQCKHDCKQLKLIKIIKCKKYEKRSLATSEANFSLDEEKK